MSTPTPSSRAVVASRRLPGRGLVGFHVEQPAVGRVEGDLVVTGWVVSEQTRRPRVGVMTRDRHLGHVRADRERPDVAEAFPHLEHGGVSGFRIRVPSTMLDTAGEVFVAVGAGGEDTIPMWAIRWAPEEVRSPRRRRGRRAKEETVDVSFPARTTDDFRIVALVSAFNEADIIGPVLDHLWGSGIEAYLIDNESTDDTVAIAGERLGRGLLGIETLARDGGGRVSWQRILDRKLELSRELGADWYLHHDADEIRESPWPGVTLGDAIRAVDRLGYNAIDFRVLNFRPVDDAFQPGDDPGEHFQHWEDPAEYDRMQRKAWKAGFADVVLDGGGHDVTFPDRRLFPQRFLLRHYPIRSQAHGERKVLHERKDRFSADELTMGWHRQYDDIRGPEHVFLKNPAALRPFDLDAIRLETMLEDGGATLADAHQPVADGAVRGFLEQATTRRISGWAASENGHGEPLNVEIWDGGERIATTPADQAREDLEKHGIPGGRAGFSIESPPNLDDGRPHWIWATVEGTGVALSRSPLVLNE
jgi:Glycosyl transferase family 2